jgi:hypothetical protein
MFSVPWPHANSMRYPDPDWVNRQIAENQKVTQRARLQALAAIVRPSLSQFLRLLNNPDTLARLMELAAKRYQTEMLERELRKRARRPQNTPTDN